MDPFASSPDKDRARARARNAPSQQSISKSLQSLSIPHPTPLDPTAPLTAGLNDLALSPVSPLSPLDTSSRSTAAIHERSPRTPQRATSYTSLRDENRKSTPTLTKRSSTASLHSVMNGGSSSSPRPSLNSRRFATPP